MESLSGEESDDKFLESIIDRQVRVSISDERVVEGTLVCADSFGNLVLENSTIHSPGRNMGYSLASVMVPGAHLLKLEIQKR